MFSYVVLTATAAQAAPYRPVDPANTLVITTTQGRIVVAMAPRFATMAVARVKRLAREHVYDGLLFHRVVDGFVDQTGNPNNHDGGVSHYPNLPPEFLFPLGGAMDATIVSRSDDAISGFLGVQPFEAIPVPGQPGIYRGWGAYCAGVAGMGRQAAIDTANSEIFFMRAPSRRLDHDYAVWGFVVSGLDVVRRMAVGFPPANPDRMLRVQVMEDMLQADRPVIRVMDTRSAEFASRVAAIRRDRGADFSICDVTVPVQQDQ